MPRCYVRSDAPDATVRAVLADLTDGVADGVDDAGRALLVVDGADVDALVVALAVADVVGAVRRAREGDGVRVVSVAPTWGGRPGAAGEDMRDDPWDTTPSFRHDASTTDRSLTRVPEAGGRAAPLVARDVSSASRSREFSRRLTPDAPPAAGAHRAVVESGPATRTAHQDQVILDEDAVSTAVDGDGVVVLDAPAQTLLSEHYVLSPQVAPGVLPRSSSRDPFRLQRHVVDLSAWLANGLPLTTLSQRLAAVSTLIDTGSARIEIETSQLASTVPAHYELTTPDQAALDDALLTWVRQLRHPRGHVRVVEAESRKRILVAIRSYPQVTSPPEYVRLVLPRDRSTLVVPARWTRADVESVVSDDVILADDTSDSAPIVTRVVITIERGRCQLALADATARVPDAYTRSRYVERTR